jgi:hypothetical protein
MLTIVNLERRMKMVEEAFEDPPPSLQHDGSSTSLRRSGMRSGSGMW